MQDQPDPAIPFAVRLTIPHALDRELAWFVEKDTTGGPPTPAPAPFKPFDPTVAWNRVAYDAIGRWLRALDAYDADVLRCAFAPPDPQPCPLDKRLGRLRPLVTRFAHGEPGWPDALHWRVVKRHTRTAYEVLRAALRAYAHERGHGPCMVSRND